MFSGGRKNVSWLAIFAIALHTILAGVLLPAFAAPVDPFSVICHSQSIDAAPDSQTGLPGQTPSGPCDHCKLCSAAAAPLAPEALLDSDLKPTGLVEVLYPVSYTHLTLPTIYSV